jgi:glyoxylate/hydroxypyruvate reductase A
MLLLVNSGGESALPEWQKQFREFAPDLDVRWWNDPSVRPEDVDYVLVWAPEPGRLATFPNLRLILSTAAGVDHITRDPDLPAHLQIVRMASLEGAQLMGEFVALAALALLRDFKPILANQASSRWATVATKRCAWDVRAGVLGMGVLGTRSAEMLRALGFATAGWSRSPKNVQGVQSFVGDGEFEAFVARTDLLVCLLPDTPATRGILGARTFAQLPAGAAIVNVARGGHLVLPDLIEALDHGKLSGAVLDVFDVEPLPATSPVWTHPKIIVTPHCAATASQRGRARHVADVIAAHERGVPMSFCYYDPSRGY